MRPLESHEALTVCAQRLQSERESLTAGPHTLRNASAALILPAGRGQSIPALRGHLAFGVHRLWSDALDA